MKKLKALLINGSPRAKGCTYTALTELKNTLEQEGMEVELIHVGHKDVHGCIACRKCKEIGKCVFDDIVNEVAPKFNEADAFVIGAPVYYASPAGGAIAFLTNVPMSFLEKKIFRRAKKENKIVEKLARPISLFLTIVFAVGVIVLVMFGVIPQLTRTMGTLMMSIADFIPQMQSWIREFSHNNQEIMKLVDQVQFNPDQAIKWGISLLGNGAGNMMNTTMSAVGSIVSGLATFFIAFSFACYVLFQKEKLHVQIRKVFFAFLPKQKADAFLKVCSLTYRTFANFLAGQCLEAVILGCMFVVILSILRMPYALLIGILIAFTALIPIFGAFIGCAVGSFLIFMVNPKQAILFIIVFLVLQQIEGNLIYPHVVGESVGLPSIWVLAAVTIGGNLMGIVGMLVFIPLLSVFYTIFREFVYLRLKKKHIKQVTKTEIEEYTAEEIVNSDISEGK